MHGAANTSGASANERPCFEMLAASLSGSKVNRIGLFIVLASIRRVDQQ
jgi:hypothetical protein